MFIRTHHGTRLACAALLALVAAIPLSAPPANAQAVVPLVRVGTGTDDSTTPLLYAVQAGLYRKYGLNVELVKVAGGSAATAAVAGGSLDIAKTSSLGLVTAIAKGIPLAAIGSISYYNADKADVALLVAGNSEIRTAKDLEGKTFAVVSLQDMNAITTFAWLDQHGVDRSTLKYVEIPPSATLAAMEQNRVVASTIYEPFYTAFEATGKVRILGHPFDAAGKHFSSALLFAKTAWADEHRELVEKFLRATQEASAYVAAHENGSIPLLAQFGDFDPASIANIHHVGRGVALVAADLQPVIDYAAKYQVIPKSFPAAEMICSCALRK